MTIDELLNKHSDNYRFHGVQAETLEALVEQSQNGQIALWGTERDEHVDGDDFDYEEDNEYIQGDGFLYVTNINDIDMPYQEFCGVNGDGMVFVLEKVVDAPFEFDHPSDRRQRIIKCGEWRVVGGLRPVFDEDEEIVDQEVFSLEEIIGGDYE